MRRFTPLHGWRYMVYGLMLAMMKFALDALLLHLVFGLTWSTALYVNQAEQFRSVADSGDGLQLYLAMMFSSAPFLLLGLWLTLRRLKTLNFPLWMVFFVVIPYVNIITFFILSVIPEKAMVQAGPKELDRLRRQFPDFSSSSTVPHKPSTSRPGMLSALLAIGVTALAGLMLVFAGIHVTAVYGVALFVGLPVCLGGFAAILYGQFGRCSVGSCIGVANLSIVFLGILALVVALEGAICLLMAAPIWFLFATIGGCIGFSILRFAHEAHYRAMILLLLATPWLMGMEKFTLPEPMLREIKTEVVVEAPIQLVWDTVIAFPPIESHRNAIFRTGIAAPLSARIEGRPGVGAVRFCEFTTGPFVEPITEWSEPTRLAFDVTHSPATMEEWTPYHELNTPHLHGTLVSERGCFELEELPNGRTRLSGTTWYRNHMWPAWYWNPQSDYIIQAIHGEVLEHIAAHAEDSERP